MRKIIIVMIICIICIAGIMIFANMFSGTENKQTGVTGKSAVTEQPVPVPRSIDVFGIIKAKETRNIVIDFPAYVEKVMVREGERVGNGMPLVRLNTLEYRQQILTTENEFKNAKNIYNQDLKQLTDREELWRAGSLSRYDFEEFCKTVDAQKMNMLNLTSSLQVMKDRLNRPYIRNNEIIADLKNAVVYNLNCSVGDKLGQPDPVCILSILDLNSLFVLADVDEELITKIRPGAKAVIKLLADHTLEYQGTITRIYDRAIIKNNETYIPVEIMIDNIDAHIAPEMNADLKISTN